MEDQMVWINSYQCSTGSPHQSGSCCFSTQDADHVDPAVYAPAHEVEEDALAEDGVVDEEVGGDDVVGRPQD